jgi:predicted PurR-regulated permease PerM
MGLMGYLLYELVQPFLEPICWAMLLAFLAHPLLAPCARVLRSRSLGALAIAAALAVGIVLPLVWLSVTLATRARSIYALSQLLESGTAAAAVGPIVLPPALAPLADKLAAHGFQLQDLARSISQGRQFVISRLAGDLAEVARHLLSFVIGVGVMLLSFFYLVRDGELYFDLLKRLTPLREADKSLVFDTLRTMLSSVVRGLLLIALLEGAVIGLGFLAAGVPDWFLLGLVTAAAALLPFAGPVLIWMPAVVYLWLAGSPGHALALAVWSGAATTLIDHILKPAAIGQGAGLPAIVLFFAITGGVEVYGPLGIFAGPAVVAVFGALLKVYRERYLRPEAQTTAPGA